MRIIGSFIALLLLALLGFLAFRWTRGNPELPLVASFKEPKVELYGFFLKNISFTHTVADVQLLIDNTSPISLDADSLHYQVYIEGAEVTSGSYQNPIHLNANDTTLLTLPVTIDNQKFLRQMQNLDGQRADSASYTLKAQVFTNLPLLKKKPFHFQLSRKMPVYLIPDLKQLEEQLRRFGS